jgi:hypothetical protein
MSELVEMEYTDVPVNIAKARTVLQDDQEPAVKFSQSCRKPYACTFWQYCSRCLPKPSVFNLYSIRFNTALKHYNKDIVRFEDVQSVKLTDMQRLQVNCELSGNGYINKNGIRSFLDANIRYPLYFLDFETMQDAIPQYEGTKPYQQIPFQYSLHYLESPDGELKHKEFLAESGVDPRRAIAESLCRDIPENVCVLAYNKGFECGRLEELAERFSDLRNHLMNISINMRDLIVPFQSGYVYNRRMGGSFSIKSVLPALFPDDPSLDYHNLEGVHNGSEAMAIFPKIKDMSPEDRDTVRKNLLKYCELDTFAMVKIYEYLRNVIKE